MDDKIKYFFPKLRNRLSAQKTRLFEKLPVEIISLRGIDTCGGWRGMTDRLHVLLGKSVTESIRYNNDTGAILAAANKACNHVFALLGSGDVKLDPIIWNKEIKTGFEWPTGVYYSKLRKTTPQDSDIKIPWELSRCHHLLWLGEAYVLTGEEKYAWEVANELNDWIDTNPLMYSVNWTCAMEVAIRAVNWMYALLFIVDSVHFTDELAEKVYRSLYQHGFFIYNNLERTIPYSNNHYYSDIVGLLYLGQLFHQTRQGKKWFSFALSQYYTETLAQILPSGVDYEKSVSYHRLMTELAMYPYYMLERVGANVPEIVRQRLVHMVQYVKLNAMPNGKAPMVADNDDGRFLPFVPRDFREHLYLTDSNSLDNRIVASSADMLSFESVSLGSRLIQDSKIAILRKGDSYLFVNNADRWRYDKEKSGYIGTHIHNDLLSFVYAVGGTEVIVDPGGYVYTSDMERHEEFRSTSKHNTVVVDGEEQHLRDRSRAFMMKYNSTSRFLELVEKQDCDICTGEYFTIKGRLTHNRSFRLEQQQLTITDILMKSGKEHMASLFYHFAPGISPVLEDKAVSFKMHGMRFLLKIGSSCPVKMSIKDDTVSPSYGVLQDSKTLIANVDFDETIQICTTISHR